MRGPDVLQLRLQLNCPAQQLLRSCLREQLKPVHLLLTSWLQGLNSQSASNGCLLCLEGTHCVSGYHDGRIHRVFPLLQLPTHASYAATNKHGRQ